MPTTFSFSRLSKPKGRVLTDPCQEAASVPKYSSSFRAEASGLANYNPVREIVRVGF